MKYLLIKLIDILRRSNNNISNSRLLTLKGEHRISRGGGLKSPQFFFLYKPSLVFALIKLKSKICKTEDLLRRKKYYSYVKAWDMLH